VSDVRRALEALRDPEVAADSARFFRTGPGGYGEGERIHRTYLEHARYVNNWDLVQTPPRRSSSAPTSTRGRRSCSSGWRTRRRYGRAASRSWRRSTWIRQGEVAAALHVADRLLDDPHDLIHKAVGWTLREAGQRDPERFEAFLTERYRRMPRTMLRYAVEKLPEAQRQRYLRGEA